MTTATLALNRVQKNLQAKISSASLPIINWKIVCLMSFVLCLPLLIFYVMQINDLTRGSYQIKNYEAQISQLSSENKNLQVSFAESSFLGQALDKIQAMNFQKTTNDSVRYMILQPPSSSAQVPPADKNL